VNARPDIVEPGAIPAPGSARPPNGAGRPSGDGDVRIRVATDFASPDSGAAEWNDLADACDAPVYLTFEWQSLWWKHFGSGRRLNILVFTSGGRTVGIAPLFAGRTLGADADILRFIGSGDAYSRSGGLFADDGPSDYLDFLVDPGYGLPVGEAFADYLAARRGAVGRVDLVNLRPSGPAATFILPALKSRGFTVIETPGDRCPFIEVGTDTADFVRSLPSGVRRRMNQALQLTEDREAAVRFSSNDAAEWGRFYADLVSLHQRRWNAAGFPGLFHDARSAAFQKEAAEQFLHNGWLWYGALDEAGRCVAARLAFRYRGRMYDYLSGFDETAACARRRPGMALLLAMHSACRQSGIGVLDMLRGDEKYKFELTDREERLVNAMVAGGGAGTGLPSVWRRTLRAFGFAAFLGRRETRLLRVQVRQHGTARGIAAFIRFRLGRYRRKFATGTSGEGPDRAGSGA
jgi:CelD/BcsL family acetyltransferase involved in cellulose biosynthesis